MTLFKPRKKESHKGTYGHVLLIGGSEKKPGAILLSGRAALRAGAGLVTVALPEKALQKFTKPFAQTLELMFERSSSKKIFAGKNVVGVGPGMGVDQKARSLLNSIFKKNSLPLVLDADALNIISENPKVLKTIRVPTVLTPHSGEMSRLCGRSVSYIQKNRVTVARDFAQKYGVYVVLKGFQTVIATPDGEIFINSTGNPGMATAGMGDVLTGVIASLLAQGLKFKEAIVAGVYLHGKAGDQVAARLGDRGLLATDVIEEIPFVMKELIL